MLEVRLIGTFDIQCDGKPVIVSSRAAQSLFAYLILTAGTLHRREKLAGMLWPEESEQKARAYLRNELWRIRKALPQTSKAEYLTADNLTVRFKHSSPYWLDVAGLEKLSDTSSAEELMQALYNYQGELLPGFYEDWVVLERERLQVLFEQKIACLLEILEKEQRWNETIEWSERWISFAQAPEAAYRALMVAYDALGDHAKVAYTYERCKQALRQLDLEPSEEMRALAFKQNSKVKVPIPLTSFIGREKELKEIAGLFSRSRLITLTGSGGVGKTRLAIQIVADVLDLFPDGVWFLDLAPLSDPALVPNTLASLLGLRESGEIAATDLLLNYFHSRTALVIFDNCEHLIKSCAELVHSLLTSCEHLYILATSRETLRVSGEIPYRVPSLEIPNPNTGANFLEVSSIEAIKLFVERAAVASPDFALSQQNTVTIAQICQRLDGIPLAIELAAGRSNVLSTEQILKHLDHRFDLLTNGLRSALPRHRTLHATIKWSYELLSEKERILFRRLSIFTGGLTLEAAMDISVGNDILSDEVLELLSRLVDKSMIATQMWQYGTRYYMLETLRQYAGKKLVEEGEVNQVYDKHLNYYVNWIDKLSSSDNHGTPTLMDQISVEHDNLQVALRRALDADLKAGFRLINHLGKYWFNSGLWEEGLGWCRRFLASSSSLDDNKDLGRALAAASYVALANDELGQARVWAQASLAISKEISDQNGIVRAHTALARIYPFGSKESREQLDKSLENARLIQDYNIIAYDSNLLGMIELSEGNPARARSYFIESLDTYHKMNLQDGGLWPLGNLGLLAFYDNNFESANTSWSAALISARGDKNKDAEIWMLSSLSQLALRQGKQSAALTYLNEAKEVSFSLGQDHWKGTIYSLDEAIYLIWKGGEFDRAVQICQECYQRAKETEDKHKKCRVLSVLVEWAMATGQVELGVQLAGAIEGGEPYFGKPMYALFREDIERNVNIARQKLDEAAIALLMTKGRAMTADAAIEFAFKR